jgi:hypothetical protein
MSPAPDFSLVVVCFNMRREIARTLYALSGAYQQGVDSRRYEVILVDNGSDDPPRAEEFADLDLNLRVLHCPNPTQSPVAALNLGLAECQADLIGVGIDGARMASPGLLKACTRAARLHDRAIVFTHSRSLGHDVQWKLIEAGYDRAEEDRLLDSIGWPDEGYRLFEISSGGASDTQGRHYESNALFMPRALWDETGGYDPDFQAPGGGMASADLFLRACDLADTQVIVVSGEATFHQMHTDSASTSSDRATERLKLFSREYHRLRRRPLRPARGPFWTVDLGRPGRAADGGAAETGEAKGTGQGDSRYVRLLSQVLLNEHGFELEGSWLEARDKLAGLTGAQAGKDLIDRPSTMTVRRLQRGRATGLEPISALYAYTLVGRRRVDQIILAVDQLIREKVPGDLMECGVWRGGACILMKGMLDDRRIKDRKVWVADSFEGLPEPHLDTDEGLDMTKEALPDVAVGLDLVKANFERFGLLDERVEFLRGWFKDTLPTAPVERLALLRLDGDLYSSTMDILQNLYDKVSPGGFVIVDDYGALAQCARAVNDFRAERSIVDPIQKIDWTGVYWRKSTGGKAPAV